MWPSRLILNRKQVRVAEELPFPGRRSAQDGQRVTGAANRLSARRRHGHAELRTAPGGIAADLHFQHLAFTFDSQVFHLFGSRRKSCFSERRGAGNVEQRVVVNEAKDCFGIARLAGREPGGDQISNGGSSSVMARMCVSVGASMAEPATLRKCISWAAVSLCVGSASVPEGRTEFPADPPCTI